MNTTRAAPTRATLTRKNALLPIARAYVAQGFSVIPVGRDKKPCLVWGCYQERPPTDAELVEWFGEGRYPCLGIVTGAVSGLVVVDVDPAGLGRVPELGLDKSRRPTVRTPRKGFHFYAQHPGGTVANATALGGLEGIDLRGDGGFVVAPPSAGEKGKWSWVLTLDDADLTVLPAPILALIGNGRPTAAAPIPERIPQGQRNATLTSLAGSMRARGLDEETILAALVAVNVARCDPLLPDEELRTIAHSIGAKPAPDLPDGPRVLGEIAPAAEGRPSSPVVTCRTAAAILRTEYAEPTWVVPEVIPTGLTILAGRPKLGKSWLCLQVAHARGTGGMALGQKVAPGRVLYLALEDRERRLKKRMVAQQWGQVETVHFETQAGPADLLRLLDETEADTCIIDTLSAFYGVTLKDQNDVAEVSVKLHELQQVANERDLAILVVDHHNKAGSGDLLVDLLGSTGKGATADTLLGLYRERGERDATLKVTGRDVDDLELKMRWDGFLCCWQVIADAAGGLTRKHSAEVLADVIAGPKTAREIAKDLGLSTSSVSRCLADLCNCMPARVAVSEGRYRVVV